MLNVSAEAQTVVKEAMQEKDLDQPLRVYLAGGCGGAQLALSLDEERDGDDKYEFDGYTYLVAKELAADTGDLTLDYVDDGIRKGLVVGSANPLPEDAGCGGGCSC